MFNFHWLILIVHNIREIQLFFKRCAIELIFEKIKYSNFSQIKTLHYRNLYRLLITKFFVDIDNAKNSINNKSHINSKNENFVESLNNFVTIKISRRLTSNYIIENEQSSLVDLSNSIEQSTKLLKKSFDWKRFRYFLFIMFLFNIYNFFFSFFLYI